MVMGIIVNSEYTPNQIKYLLYNQYKRNLKIKKTIEMIITHTELKRCIFVLLLLFVNNI